MLQNTQLRAQSSDLRWRTIMMLTRTCLYLSVPASIARTRGLSWHQNNVGQATKWKILMNCVWFSVSMKLQWIECWAFEASMGFSHSSLITSCLDSTMCTFCDGWFQSFPPDPMLVSILRSPHTPIGRTTSRITGRINQVYQLKRDVPYQQKHGSLKDTLGDPLNGDNIESPNMDHRHEAFRRTI